VTINAQVGIALSTANQSVEATLTKGSFEATLKDAITDGPPGEAWLVQTLPSLRGFDQMIAVAALGDAQGDQGIPALRALLATPQRAVDLRCAALLALAKRARDDACDVLAAHVTHVPPAVADYAVMCLACGGDDRAWPQAHRRLRQQLDRPPPTVQPHEILLGMPHFRALFTIAYLARHLNAAPSERIPRLVTTLRSRFDRLYAVEQDWLSQHWPGINPGGPRPTRLTAPDPAPFQALAKQSRLCAPVF
jgi:hypothetical protein